MAKEEKNLVSETNPFGEELVTVVIPKDNLNKDMVVKWISINGVALAFPVGKAAKMPMSYYNVYINAMESQQIADEKLQENEMKLV